MRRAAAALGVLLASSLHAAEVPGCREFAARVPNVPLRLCDQAQMLPGDGRSVQGTPLYLRDVAAPGDAVRVPVVGAIHGDEL